MKSNISEALILAMLDAAEAGDKDKVEAIGELTEDDLEDLETEKRMKKSPVQKGHTRDAPVLGIDDDNRVVTYVMSTADEDRDGETVNPEGGDFSTFSVNRVVSFNHDTDTFPVGKLLKWWNDEVGEGTQYDQIPGPRRTALLGNVYFSKENPQGDLAFRMVKEGTLGGGSISFLPDGEAKKNAKGGNHYDRWKLLEFAVCPIGSNPYAVAMAVAKRFQKAPYALPPKVGETYRTPDGPAKIARVNSVYVWLEYEKDSSLNGEMLVDDFAQGVKSGELRKKSISKTLSLARSVRICARSVGVTKALDVVRVPKAMRPAVKTLVEKGVEDKAKIRGWNDYVDGKAPGDNPWTYFSKPKLARAWDAGWKEGAAASREGGRHTLQRRNMEKAQGDWNDLPNPTASSGKPRSAQYRVGGHTISVNLTPSGLYNFHPDQYPIGTVGSLEQAERKLAEKYGEKPVRVKSQRINKAKGDCPKCGSDDVEHQQGDYWHCNDCGNDFWFDPTAKSLQDSESYLDGRQAFRSGKTRDDNPRTDRTSRQFWQQGWQDAKIGVMDKKRKAVIMQDKDGTWTVVDRDGNKLDWDIKDRYTAQREADDMTAMGKNKSINWTTGKPSSGILATGKGQRGEYVIRSGRGASYNWYLNGALTGNGGTPVSAKKDAEHYDETGERLHKGLMKSVVQNPKDHKWYVVYRGKPLPYGPHGTVSNPDMTNYGWGFSSKQEAEDKQYRLMETQQMGKSLHRKLWTCAKSAWILKSEGDLDEQTQEYLEERGLDDVRIEDEPPPTKSEVGSDEWVSEEEGEPEHQKGKGSFKWLQGYNANQIHHLPRSASNNDDWLEGWDYAQANPNKSIHSKAGWVDTGSGDPEPINIDIKPNSRGKYQILIDGELVPGLEDEYPSVQAAEAELKREGYRKKAISKGFEQDVAGELEKLGCDIDKYSFTTQGAQLLQQSGERGGKSAREVAQQIMQAKDRYLRAISGKSIDKAAEEYQVRGLGAGRLRGKWLGNGKQWVTDRSQAVTFPSLAAANAAIPRKDMDVCTIQTVQHKSIRKEMPDVADDEDVAAVVADRAEELKDAGVDEDDAVEASMEEEQVPEEKRGRVKTLAMKQLNKGNKTMKLYSVRCSKGYLTKDLEESDDPIGMSADDAMETAVKAKAEGMTNVTTGPALTDEEEVPTELNKSITIPAADLDEYQLLTKEGKVITEVRTTGDKVLVTFTDGTAKEFHRNDRVEVGKKSVSLHKGTSDLDDELTVPGADLSEAEKVLKGQLEGCVARRMKSEEMPIEEAYKRCCAKSIDKRLSQKLWPHVKSGLRRKSFDPNSGPIGQQALDKLIKTIEEDMKALHKSEQGATIDAMERTLKDLRKVRRRAYGEPEEEPVEMGAEVEEELVEPAGKRLKRNKKTPVKAKAPDGPAGEAVEFLDDAAEAPETPKALRQSMKAVSAMLKGSEVEDMDDSIASAARDMKLHLKDVPCEHEEPMKAAYRKLMGLQKRLQRKADGMTNVTTGADLTDEEEQPTEFEGTKRLRKGTSDLDSDLSVPGSEVEKADDDEEAVQEACKAVEDVADDAATPKRLAVVMRGHALRLRKALRVMKADKPLTDEAELDPEFQGTKSKGTSDLDSDLSVPASEVEKDAAETMEDMAEAPETPKRFKAGLRYLARKLKNGDDEEPEEKEFDEEEEEALQKGLNALRNQRLSLESSFYRHTAQRL